MRHIRSGRQIWASELGWVYFLPGLDRASVQFYAHARPGGQLDVPISGLDLVLEKVLARDPVLQQPLLDRACRDGLGSDELSGSHAPVARDHRDATGGRQGAILIISVMPLSAKETGL